MAPTSSVALTFIGGGVLATSIIDGLLEDAANAESHIQYNISITVRRDEHAAELRQRYPGVLVTTENRDPRLWDQNEFSKSSDGNAVASRNAPTARIVLLCTQPQFISTVCREMKEVMAKYSLEPAPTFVTMCPGITTQQLGSWLKSQVPIVRTMPNTPVSVRQGATAIFPNKFATQSDVEQVTALFRPISPCVCVLSREDHLDVAASISGYADQSLCVLSVADYPSSSPAYFFTLMDALIQAAVARGFSPENASMLVKQSALGSAVLSQPPDAPLHDLISNVCVPGGSTQKAVSCLHERDLYDTVDAAVERSLVANRSMGGERALM